MDAAMGRTMTGKSARIMIPRDETLEAPVDELKARGGQIRSHKVNADGDDAYSLEEVLEQCRRDPYAIGPCPDAVKTGSPKPHKKPKLDRAHIDGGGQLGFQVVALVSKGQDPKQA